MRARRVFQVMQPYLTAIAVICIAGLLIFAIYFTELGVQWITFLTGILIASIISMVSRTSRAEWIIARRTAQLKSIKDKLDKETQLRKSPLTSTKNHFPC